jgi:ElaB/YqjD/DUF883 family membrane-anchored ribosome-binding protein
MNDPMKDKADAKTDGGIKEQLKHVVEAGQEKAEVIKDKIVDAKDAVVERAGSMKTSLADRIKSNPLASVGIAFGVGYLAMRIFRR